MRIGGILPPVLFYEKGTGISNHIPVHRTIYRHVILCLGIVLDKGYWSEFCGTYNRRYIS